MRWLGLLLLAPLLACSETADTPVADAAAQPDERLIVAGERVGEWWLGRDIADRPRDEQAQLMTDLARQGVMLQLARTRVSAISLTSKEYRTADDIGIGSPRSDVERVYGKVAAESVGSFMLPTYAYDGIRFMIRDDKVTMIEITAAN